MSFLPAICAVAVVLILAVVLLVTTRRGGRDAPVVRRRYARMLLATVAAVLLAAGSAVAVYRELVVEGIALAGVAVAAIVWMIRYRVSDSEAAENYRQNPLYCGRCGYDLRGLTRGECPECGWSIREAGDG